MGASGSNARGFRLRSNLRNPKTSVLAVGLELDQCAQLADELATICRFAVAAPAGVASSICHVFKFDLLVIMGNVSRSEVLADLAPAWRGNLVVVDALDAGLAVSAVRRQLAAE